MAFIGNVLQELVKISGKNPVPSVIKRKANRSPFQMQIAVLRKLIKAARATRIGKEYHFQQLLKKKNLAKAFAETVPVFTYNEIYDRYWKHTLNDEADITWPGKIKYFALTSGTSESSSKRVPVSKEMLKAIKKTSLRQTLSLRNIELPPKFYEKSVMMLGGSIDLKKVGAHYEGDLSGILIKRIPLWMHMFYKPGHEIARIRDWNIKLAAITRKANEWDIGVIAGVPAWYQLLFNQMLSYYHLENIHQIWPELRVFLHGGVSFDPYRESFQQYFERPLIYLETYLASEGFFAFQEAGEENMRLVLDNGIYFEFIPFNEQYFDEEGNLRSSVQVFNIGQVREGEEYALLISTCAGAWRYLIGDTIRFLNTKTSEIKITGRTKMFLSLCGEHLSVDNMNEAIRRTARDIGCPINEYTVSGEKEGSYFRHRWYLGMAGGVSVSAEKIREILDMHLQELNDDYATERKAALKYMEVELLPLSVFYNWMESIGKLGAQNKFPRVMKGSRLEDWERYLNTHYRSNG